MTLEQKFKFELAEGDEVTEFQSAEVTERVLPSTF